MRSKWPTLTKEIQRRAIGPHESAQFASAISDLAAELYESEIL